MFKIYIIFFVIFFSFQELFSEIKILAPESEFKTCRNDSLLIKWNNNEAVFIEVRILQNDYTRIVPRSITGGEFYWKVTDPKFLNNPVDIKVTNAFDNNDYDEISNIIIYQETKILSQTQSAVYCKGEKVILTIDAEGFNLKYQWYRDDNILENEAKSILLLSDLQYEHSASYECKVIGELDCNTIMSKPIAVYIATPTDIIVQPQHQGWSWGEYAKFSVKVHINSNGEDKDIKFQWFKGSEPIYNEYGNYTFYKNKPRISGAQSEVLEYLYLMPKDSSDSIYCVITGRCGSIKTRYVKLQEDAFFKYKLLTPEITVCVGDSAVLKVAVTQREPGTLIYEWYRIGNRKIIDNGRYSGADTPTLTIHNSISSDLGTYYLKITHKESDFSFKTPMISLYAESDPNIITKFSDYTAYDRRNSPYYYGKINLTTGSLLMVDKYYFQWYRNDTLIQKGKGLAGATILISNPTLSDEGKYYCIITGGCGVSYTDTFNVFLGYKDILLCQGYDTILSVRKHKSDTGQMKYYWMFRNSKIKDVGRYDGTSTRNLTVKSVTVSQEGEYTSFAVDTILNKTYSNGFIYLDVGGAPKISKINFNSPIYMKTGMPAKKIMSIVTKKSMKIELYKDTVLRAYKYFIPENWMDNVYTFFIGCYSVDVSCFCGVLPSGKYKFRFINDCGETWSNEFTVINIDTTSGIVYSPDKDNNETSDYFTNTLSVSDDNIPEFQDSIHAGMDNSDSSVIIYPNPANDYIEISYINPMLKHGVDVGSEIQIFNTLGEIMMSVEQKSPSVQSIDISNLAPGIYFIKIENRIEKFVKI